MYDRQFKVVFDAIRERMAPQPGDFSRKIAATVNSLTAPVAYNH
jgi:hypothetical protein